MATSGAPGCLTFTASAPPFDGARAAAEQIEAEVFLASFGESADKLRRYYDGHLDQTAFVLAGQDGWSGMMRVGVPGPRPSLTAEDAARPPFDVDLEAELGSAVLLDVLTAAVRTPDRNQGTLGPMLAAAVRLAREHACTHLVAMVDGGLVEVLRAGGLPGTVHSDLHPYYGSPATAVTSIPVTALRGWLRGLAA